MFPYVNSRDCVDKLGVQMCINWFRTCEILCFNWFNSSVTVVNSQDCEEKFGVQTRVLTGSEHVKSCVSTG